MGAYRERRTGVMPVRVLGSSKGQRSRRAEWGAGRSSRLVLIVRDLPAVTQLLLISCWSAIRLLVVVATVAVVVATETAEFAGVGAARGGQGRVFVESKGLHHLRDHRGAGVGGGHGQRRAVYQEVQTGNRGSTPGTRRTMTSSSRP